MAYWPIRGRQFQAASEFMRTIQSGSRTSTLVRAIAELVRIAKTLFCWLTLTTKPIAAAS
jgi:TnpA family transposase